MRSAGLLGALALIAAASADVPPADPAPMPEIYLVSLAKVGENKETKDAVEAFMRKVLELGQKGRAGRMTLRLGETGSMLGGMCVEFIDDAAAEEAFQPLRVLNGIAIGKEKCM
jgi:hypothetical protein